MNRDKELYRQLRNLCWDELWTNEVPRFNSATARERLERVAVVRAAAVVFAESGAANQLIEIKTWLHALLSDPQEKIRRYAIAALPKLPRDPNDEQQLIALAKKPASDREKQHVANALSKIGGKETLRHAELLPPRALQRAKASVLRAESASAINLAASLTALGRTGASPVPVGAPPAELLLRSRAGLETFVRDEATDFIRAHGKFRLAETKTGLVVLNPIAPFTLTEIFSMRCFGEVAFALPVSRNQDRERLAEVITSPSALNILRTSTTGPIRYRLDFVGKGHQRAAVRDLAQRIFSKNPDLINGGGDTPWTIEIQTTSKGARILLVPKISPDPRFAYRRRDIPAASHPPLAACMARLSSKNWEGERPREPYIVWDPFCGSGLELIERVLLGNVAKIIGTDLSPEALKIAQQNFAAANLQNIETQFIASDFRNFDPGLVSLIITNPPMGKRVPIPNLRQLITNLFDAAARHLKPNGHLIFANPLNLTPTNPSLKRIFSQLIDFGGFHCRLEKYSKT